MKELKINPEFEKLLPPLTAEEYAGLEADIIANGCREPITVWNGVVVDGHNRLHICRKNQVAYSISEMVFPSENSAKIWIWKNQGNRRNLTPLAKIELAMKMKPILEAEAKERMRLGGGDKKSASYKSEKSGVEILPPPISGKVRDELAEQAGVSGRTYEKGVYVLEHADEETKEKLRRGERGVSISGVYNDLRNQNAPKAEETPADVPTPIEPSVTDNPDVKETTDETFIDPMAAMSDEERQAYEWSNNRVNLKMISRTFPSSLIGCLLEVFDAEYRHKFIPELLEGMIRVEGKESVRGLVKQVYKKFSK